MLRPEGSTVGALRYYGTMNKNENTFSPSSFHIEVGADQSAYVTHDHCSWAVGFRGFRQAYASMREHRC